MWKVLLALITHRVLLLVVALFAINHSLPVSPNRTSMLPQIHPMHELSQRLISRLDESPDVAALAQSESASAAGHTSPFYWVARWTVKLTGLSPAMALLVVSNIFLLLFLGELNALFNRMVTPDVAASATILIVLWPTSYELSLGSAFAFTCFALATAVRGALDNQWLIAGIASAALALAEPVVLGILPLMLFVFWYFQRHYKINQVIKRACFFFLPLALALAWAWRTYPPIDEMIANSALSQLYHNASQGKALTWSLSRPMAGQTLAVVFFAIGAVAAFFSNTTLVHRLIPVSLWLVLLLFSPYPALASRAPLAAACLEGVTSASAGPVLRLVQLLLLLLGVYEVAAVFG